MRSRDTRADDRGRPTGADSGRDRADDGGRPALRLRVARGGDGPDRATIHPPALTGIERMETWLSADLDAFVSLSARR